MALIFPREKGIIIAGDYFIIFLNHNIGVAEVNPSYFSNTQE